MEVSRLSGMDNDLFKYRVEVANIPCNSVMDDDLEDELIMIWVNEYYYLLKDYEWYEALDDCELKEEALRNKAIMDGVMQ
ncbi:hypothetical protein Tco_0729635 [Tanacetum coccineum]|uniref:Uncharacterized protein n=1 Tax=Tanacetum coccineum TaxID=301880 RepID=A0ABQ4YPE7_9ASTR